MATIDEILRRTAYQRPHMKNYKPMFGGGSDAPGRFGGSNFASSTLGYSDTPSGQGFNTPQNSTQPSPQESHTTALRRL